MININIINYKFFSRRYIIYETKKKGKEYDALEYTMIYEGEFLNGERNGKGKEYNDNGQLIFEGEFKQGKRWKGKCKEYHIYNSLKITFEGEYLNGKKWKGKEYSYGEQNLMILIILI